MVTTVYESISRHFNIDSLYHIEINPLHTYISGGIMHLSMSTTTTHTQEVPIPWCGFDICFFHLLLFRYWIVEYNTNRIQAPNLWFLIMAIY